MNDQSPKNTAQTVLPGTPKVRVGIRAPPISALFAVSQETTPQARLYQNVPVASMSSWRHNRQQNLQGFPPAPGAMPRIRPITHERKIMYLLAKVFQHVVINSTLHSRHNAPLTVLPYSDHIDDFRKGI